MKLIADWKKAWQLITVQLGAIAVVWVTLPAETQEAILRVLHVDRDYLPGIIGIAVIVGRLIAQPGLRK